MKLSLREAQLVVFDLDGTLVDAYPAITDSINHMMKQLGRPKQTLRTVTRSVGWGVDSLVSAFVPEPLAAEALAIFRAHHDQRLRRNVRRQPGAAVLLRFLHKRGIKLAIASNRPSQFCRIILNTVGLERYFFKVVGGDDVKTPKPHPAMLNLILREARVDPLRVVYVGDMTVDIKCGRAAGVCTVAIPTGSCTLRQIRSEKPDILVRKLMDLKPLFLKTVRGD